MDMKELSLVLPLVYDHTTRVTQLAERREAQSIITTTVNHQLRRFAELCNMQHTESSLFAAVRDLLANLTLPNEQQPMQQQMQNAGPPMVNSPNPQMMGPGQNPGPGM
jgi:mediator of RNA polymerase II transcription subunit 14